MDAVVEAWNIHRRSYTTLDGSLGMVESLCHRTGGVEGMAGVLKVLGNLLALGAALLRNLVTYRPHDDTRMVAVGEYEVLDVFLPPVLEEAGIAVLALRIEPHVKTLGHHHHAQ